jgi:hypothetical protein
MSASQCCMNSGGYLDYVLGCASWVRVGARHFCVQPASIHPWHSVSYSTSLLLTSWWCWLQALHWTRLHRAADAGDSVAVETLWRAGADLLALDGVRGVE